ncbi:hypothetical protein M0R45_000279 [Rubus argutus]|uniref:pyruvate decarboxylase n=1 Tax=Rubus argutus TaxID=59490 RepID=A0AAW1VPT2_RUBAR
MIGNSRFIRLLVSGIFRKLWFWTFQFIATEQELNLVSCCNELNAGYAADGYARSHGVGACVVAFNVGGLILLNAIAGASENPPVICIVGGPNSNDYGTNRILHRSIGLSDFSQELKCFQTVTGHQISRYHKDTIWLV